MKIDPKLVAFLTRDYGGGTAIDASYKFTVSHIADKYDQAYYDSRPESSIKVVMANRLDELIYGDQYKIETVAKLLIEMLKTSQQDKTVMYTHGKDWEEIIQTARQLEQLLKPEGDYSERNEKSGTEVCEESMHISR